MERRTFQKLQSENTSNPLHELLAQQKSRWTKNLRALSSQRQRLTEGLSFLSNHYGTGSPSVGKEGFRGCKNPLHSPEDHWLLCAQLRGHRQFSLPQQEATFFCVF